MRCYNGCPDKELQALIDARQAAHDEARKLGIHICWFPVEERYYASTALDNGPYRDLSGPHHHPRDALEEAKTRL